MAVRVDESFYIYPNERSQKVPVTVAEFDAFILNASAVFRISWEQIKAQVENGDELWVVCSPREDWMGFTGFEALSHCRRGIEINQLVICRS